MVAAAGSGTRITLARDALQSALSLLPDSYAGGVWDFAYRLQGDQDWQQLAAIAPFGTDVGGGKTQRKVIQEQFASLPDRLRPGGTALYDTTLAAVRASRAAFDPAAVNSVVLITDGRNEDDKGIGLDQLLATLGTEADASRPVKVVAIGIGPDADMGALQKIAATTGGRRTRPSTRPTCRTCSSTPSAAAPRHLEVVALNPLGFVAPEREEGVEGGGDLLDGDPLQRRVERRAVRVAPVLAAVAVPEHLVTLVGRRAPPLGRHGTEQRDRRGAVGGGHVRDPGVAADEQARPADQGQSSGRLRSSADLDVGGEADALRRAHARPGRR